MLNSFMRRVFIRRCVDWQDHVVWAVYAFWGLADAVAESSWDCLFRRLVSVYPGGVCTLFFYYFFSR